MTGKKPRLYPDFNGYRRGTATHPVELDTFGTLVDLHYFKIRLTDGLEIMAWDQSDDEEDMEVIGQCRYHSSAGRSGWCVHFPPDSLVYVPRRADSVHHPFVCFQCR